MVNKVYPPGEITPYGSKLLRERVHPMIIYTSHDNSIEWNLHGPMAPMPGVQEGAYLTDGISGLHPTFSQIEHKGARQDGVTSQHVVYDPAEMDMQVEFTAAPNPANPELAAANIRRVIREWMESWDPRKPGTLSYTTPDAGRWWCKPRLYKAPPDRQFKAQGRRRRQKYTWTIRNDDAFWRSNASISVFDSGHTNQIVTIFPDAVPGGIGSEWEQIYAGPGGGVQEVVDGQVVWQPAGILERRVVNVFKGQNNVQIVGFSGDGIPQGGTFKLIYDPDGVNQTTTALQWNASAFEVQSALEVLPAIGVGNVDVISAGFGVYYVYFINGLGLRDIPVLGTISNLTGSAPVVTAANLNGAPGTGGSGAVGTTAVSVITGSLNGAPGTPGVGDPSLTEHGGGELPNIPPGDGAPGTMGYVPPPSQTASIDIFGWFNSARTDGVQANISNGNVILSSIVGGITTILRIGAGIIGAIADTVFTLVTEVVEVAVGIFQQVVTLIANGIRIIAGIIGSVIGAFFEVIGFGQHAGENENGQTAPPGITGFGAGVPVTTASGQVALTNIGDQDGWPDYLCYGPGTFRISNGPGGSMVEFGPLVEGQVGLLRTLPSKRGVVDLTPNIVTASVTPEFDDFVTRLLSLAVNNNTGGLRTWFQSLFGINPPQGNMYSLLKGRFTNPIPPKLPGQPATPVMIRTEIDNGNSNSRIIAGLTPLRRWPE